MIVGVQISSRTTRTNHGGEEMGCGGEGQRGGEEGDGPESQHIMD
jgi:hypothetical protein